MKTIIYLVMFAAAVMTVSSVKGVMAIGNTDIAERNDAIIECALNGGALNNAKCYDSTGQRVADYGNLKKTFGSATARLVAVE